MTYSNNDDAIALVDSNGNTLAVSQSQTIITGSQPGFLNFGYDGTSSKMLKVTNSGSLFVTGTVDIVVNDGGYGGQIEGLDLDNNTITANPVLVGGADGTLSRKILVDSLGRIVTAPAGSSTAVTSSLEVGYVATAAVTRVPVRATAYTEQTTNAQRSIASANAADTAAGTGARTVQITYLDQNFNGPYTEIVTLNGTTPVNTVNSNICYIEDMRVITAGSGGVNAGIISLRSTTGGGGVTISSIAAGDNRLFYSMHYVINGKVCYITGISVSHNGTTVGSGGVFTIASKDLSVANSAEIIVSDYVRQYGQASNTTRTWGTAIKITGPARITVYVAPESASSFTYRAALDLYDQ